MEYNNIRQVIKVINDIQKNVNILEQGKIIGTERYKGEEN